ncbi:MAG TPA: hypothetical protein VFS39_16305 [Nitrospira sp.]|nr:hypothetical protein [Nitrospira sp.]
MMGWRYGSCALSLCLASVAVSAMPGSQAGAAEWLAPAPQANIKADWVQDVGKGLRSNRFRNVFMNQPFGCDQCRILQYLADAAEALESHQPKLAKSFVRRALSVLDAGVDEGWYDEDDVRPIKRLILNKAKQGFQAAGASELAMSVPEKPGQDPRYQRGADPMFSGSDESTEYGSRRDRWSGYTSQRKLGLTNEPPDRDGYADEFGRTTGGSGPYSDRYADEVQKMSEMGRKSSAGSPFAGIYGDVVERWATQSGSGG